jgi:glycosyltransferase involved in cell wall biosynthesis
MSNAALYFHSDAYDTTRGQLMGRHSAGESFLRGFLRHGAVEQFHFWNVEGARLDKLTGLVQRIHPVEKPITWHPGRRQLGEVGVLNMPVPGLPDEAWARRPLGERTYAICGVTHTTATERIMRNMADLLLSPLHDYDAMICTSHAVRQSVETQLDGVRAYLAEEYGPRRRPEPQRATIPLGVNVEDFTTTPEARKAWRERLDIPEEAIVALYVGRFDPRAKMNPALMALALEQAAKRTSRPLYWVASGWGAAPASEAAFHEHARALCPSVQYRNVDGRPADVRFSIWSVADLFISFSDNIQETFGLTPVEAMAAGLPCVVTDWDGYRDTVRHGEDGFRIATYAPRSGDGEDLAYAFADRKVSYENYVGAAAQFTAIDLAAAAQAIVDLAENADLRSRMGAQARLQAQAVFDWSRIIPQYQELWAEQNARRLAAPAAQGQPGNPFRPDPFRLFAGYPTHQIQPSWRVSLPSGTHVGELALVLASPLASYSNVHRPTLDEAAKVFEWLMARNTSTVAETVAQFPPGRRPFVQRGLLWMARFGSIVLTPDA